MQRPMRCELLNNTKEFVRKVLVQYVPWDIEEMRGRPATTARLSRIQNRSPGHPTAM